MLLRQSFYVVVAVVVIVDDDVNAGLDTPLYIRITWWRRGLDDDAIFWAGWLIVCLFDQAVSHSSLRICCGVLVTMK